MNVMIDTNVVIDALEGRKPWNKAAEKIIMLAAAGKINANVTASSVTDIYYLVRKSHTKEESRKIVCDLARLVNFVAVDHNDCIKALNSKIDDFEDALIAICASKAKSKYIVSRNLSDFANSKVQAVSPDFFLKQIKTNIDK
ncbi:MAG: PIN domain-containing protein [Clostridiales bacterium]|nr:PIN domain-containing protein [Clostridiales bacterium]